MGSGEARANVAKHGVSFEEATEAFRDPFGLELLDDRFDYGEEQLMLIAMARGRLLTVVFVERGDLCRLISAWPLNQGGTGWLFRSASLICIRTRRSVH